MISNKIQVFVSVLGNIFLVWITHNYLNTNFFKGILCLTFQTVESVGTINNFLKSL